MYIGIEFETNNSAFEEDFEGEIKRILTQAEKKIVSTKNQSFNLKDVNGNAVGKVSIYEDDSEI